MNIIIFIIKNMIIINNN